MDSYNGSKPGKLRWYALKTTSASLTDKSSPGSLPFIRKQAIAARIPFEAIRQVNVLAQNTFQDGSQFFNRPSGPCIPLVNSEFHFIKSEILKSEIEHQDFYCGIEACTLKLAAEPGGADMDHHVPPVDVHKAGRAGNLSLSFVPDQKRDT
jgi:hypothetical protein